MAALHSAHTQTDAARGQYHRQRDHGGPWELNKPAHAPRAEAVQRWAHHIRYLLCRAPAPLATTYTAVPRPPSPRPSPGIHTGQPHVYRPRNSQLRHRNTTGDSTGVCSGSNGGGATRTTRVSNLGGFGWWTTKNSIKHGGGREGVLLCEWEWSVCCEELGVVERGESG